MLIEKNEIVSLLGSFKIHKYFIDENGDLHVYQDLDLSGMNLEKIPFKICTINHTLNLKGNKIKTFENFPLVSKSVILSYNSIESFNSFPIDSKVDYLVLDDNHIQNFHSGPRELTSLSVDNNPITSIEGAPLVRGKLYCEETRIFPEHCYIHEVCSLAKTWDSEKSLLENIKKIIRVSPDAYKLVSHTKFFQDNLDSLKLSLTGSKFGI